MTTNYQQTVAQIERDPANATKELRKNLPANLWVHIDSYLQDVSNTVEGNVSYNGLELTGDFMIWAKSEGVV